MYTNFTRLILFFKVSITASLALIIEASLEAYFQFWLQSNFSLPDIEFTTGQHYMEQLVTYRTFSILLSFGTIAVSIVKIRFNMISYFLVPRVFFKEQNFVCS